MESQKQDPNILIYSDQAEIFFPNCSLLEGLEWAIGQVICGLLVCM